MRVAPALRQATPSIRRAAPSIRGATPAFRRAAPLTRRTVTPRSLQRGPVQISRPRGVQPTIRRGGIATKQRIITRRKGAPAIVRRAPVDRAITKRAVRAPALVGGRNAAIRRSVLRNRAFVAPSVRKGDRALVRPNFRGQFAGKRFAHPHWARFHRHRWHRHVFVIGWVGPLFWPYAYDDFIDYTFWPYAYDTFWPYAYDDLYVSMFAPYAYVDTRYANVPAYRERSRVQRVPSGGVAQVCSVEATGLTDWPIERIAEAVEPNEAQRAALAELKSATAGAVQLMQAACPSDLAGTPTARLAAMRTRIETMLKAVAIVRPALERFFNSLNDEQKARFMALPEEPAARAGRAAPQPDLAKICSAEVSARVPTARIRQTLRPSDTQATALDALDQASLKAAEVLRADCQDDQSLTPTGRIAAMERRLKAMLQALDLVQPALERFYGSLSDEQKARFNRLPRQG